VNVLPERTNLLVKDGSVIRSEYWDLEPADRFHGSFEDKKRRFLDMFRDSIKLPMRSDVQIGGCLSGGLDSSAIASVLGTDFRERRYPTVTIYYEDKVRQMDERNWVRAVQAAFPNIDPIFCSPSDDELRGSLDQMMWLHEVPIRSSSAASYYFLMKLAARTGFRVMLDGLGADAYLAGSSSSLERFVGGYLRHLRIIKAFETLRAMGSGRAEVARRGLRAALAGERELYAAGYLERCSSLGFDGDLAFDLRPVGGSKLKQHLYHLLFSMTLPSMQHNLDRMSMGSSVESRLPFLDHRLVEFVYSLQDEDLISLGRTKYILRASLDGLLPQAIAGRTDKQGLTGREIVAWLRGPLRYLLESPIDFDRIRMVNRQKTQAWIENFKNGGNARVDLLWRLVSLNYWLKVNGQLCTPR
jgi:asparagine synthase (glutamine-hydrolysing)